MADGKGPGRITTSGLAFGALMAILIAVSLWMFIAKPWWFPTLASIHGAEIDGVFNAVLIVTGIAFVVTQAVLGYFVARYGGAGSEKADYWHDNPKGEFFLLTGTALILVVLVFMGQRVWVRYYFTDLPENATAVQVTAQQFQWQFHYPGADGKFGRTDLTLVDSTSPAGQVGLDDKDPAAKDDIVVTGEMHVPVNKPVIVKLRSKDVIHSFFLPNQRVKQDAVPGLSIEVTFTPNVAGNFELACAELCGNNHYKMKGLVTVDASEEEFNNWLKMKLSERTGD
jgi:cytochrome c oxidase subunit 2